MDSGHFFDLLLLVEERGLADELREAQVADHCVENICFDFQAVDMDAPI